MFENVTSVLFVAAISEYDQKLYEDETPNRMSEALSLFEEVVKYAFLIFICCIITILFRLSISILLCLRLVY